MTALCAGSMALTGGVGHAEATGPARAVLIPGATVFKPINPLYPIVATSYPDIGLHFHSDPAAVIVDYSQNALDSDRAIRDGVTRAAKAVRTSTVDTGDVVLIGESMGSMVAWRVAAELAAQPNPPTNLSVVLIAPPEAGVAEYFPEGTFIPVLNYRITRIKQSGFPTTVVIGEYDGWADPPDRPWNLLASANALAGTAFVHGPQIASADPANATSTTTGNVTTLLVPTPDLPLTQVFRAAGVPDELVDPVDRVLRPIIDTAYLRHDSPGDTRPYLHDGQLWSKDKPLRKVALEALQSAADDVGAGPWLAKARRNLDRTAARTRLVADKLKDGGLEAAVRQVGENIGDRVQRVRAAVDHGLDRIGVKRSNGEP